MPAEMSSTARSPIPRSGRVSGPMSFGQQRLWFGHELEPGVPHHALGRVYAIHGPLDVDALARAFDEVVRRHEPLRTTFHLENGLPIQRIEPHAPPAVPLVPLADRPLDDGWRDVDALLTRQLHDDFDPARGPILRASVARLAGGWWALVVTQRFIGADRWSRAVLHRELSQLYAAFVAGRESPLDPLPLRYVDFAAWQRARLCGVRLDRLLAYWTGQLRDAPRSPRLPGSGARAVSAPSRTGGTAYRAVSESLVRRLAAICVSQRITPFMLYLAAFAALLHRCTGDTDVVVGAPVSGRVRPETEPLIGFFGNTLVLRTDVSGDPGFADLLQRVRRTALEAYEHQELPFERLIEELPVEREPFSDPIARVLFAYQNLPDEPLRLAGCEVHERDAVSDAFAFELAVSLYPSASGLLVRAQYQRDLFAPGLIDRFLARFEMLLDGIAHDATTPVSRLPIMGDGERDAILARASGPAPVLPADGVVHRLFEAQVARTPGAIALSSAAAGMAVSYGDLDRRTARMARRLKALGVERDVVVGVAMARSPGLIAALLAVLKAGGAYLPLERNPGARTRRILEDCGVRLVLSDGSMALPRVDGLTVVDVCGLDGGSPGAADVHGPGAVDQRAHGAADGPGGSSSEEPSEDDLAYVMYTSGSTGSPKGVEVPHRAVVRLALAGIVPMGPGDVVLQLAPVSFDASTFEIWTPLAAGARLALYSEPVFDLDAFEAVVRSEGVTHLWLTASLFNTIVDLRPAALAGIRYLLAGGEALSVAHVRAAMDRHPGLRVFNGYGPTEVTTFSLVHEVERPVRQDAASIPLGRPIAHTVAVVLDGCRQLVPDGIPGELYLGGRGLARGYRNAPALTAERFLDLPIGAVPMRLYRTGDLVRSLEDGSFEFLGRRDRQVKVRGFRIELDEIEAHIAARGDVAACAVMVQDDGSGDRTLAAFIVSRPGGRMAASSVREYLAERVPAYMVPGTIRIVDALPVTPSGKIDRRALEATHPNAPASRPGATLRAATGLQDAVAEVWADVLGGAPVGPHDNFFDAGGHSLLAVQVVARLRALFDVAVPLSAIFEHPTVAGLAGTIAALRADPTPHETPCETRRESTCETAAACEAATPMAGPSARGDEAPVSFGQLRLWFLHQLDTESAAYNSTRSYLLRGPLDAGALRNACDALLARHAALRTRFVFDGREPRQIVEPALRMPFEIVDLRELPRGEREREAVRRRSAYATRGFDLATAPLARVLLLRLHDDEHVLTIVLHHIAVDGWSMGVLGRELGALHDASVAKRAAALEALPLDYVDYASWQREHFRGPRRDALLDYWRRQLQGLTPLRLPPAAGAHVEDASGERHDFALDSTLIGALRDVGHRTDATLFMVLLAGFQAVLAALAAQDDVAVGIPVANRTRRDFEGIVGFFVNTLVLRTSLAGRPTGRELIGRVRRVALEAYDHQECPFEQVVDELRPPRVEGRMPLTPVLFALQTAPDAGLSLAGMEVTRLAPAHQRVRFDLELTLRPAADGTLRGAMVYRSALLPPEGVVRLVADFERTLRGFAGDLDAPAMPHEGPTVTSIAPTRPEAARPAAAVGATAAGAEATPADPSDGHRGLTITEALLTRLWADLLRLDAIGPDDDFFELGGHSLMAVQLFARLEEECGRRLPVASLFQHGSIRRLARLLDDGRDLAWTPVVPLRSSGTEPPLFLVHGIGGEVIGFRLLARHLRGDRPVYAIQAPGPRSGRDLPFGVEALCGHYVSAVRAVHPAGPFLLGGYSAGGVFAIEIARQLRSAGFDVPLVLVLDGGLPPSARSASREMRHTPATLLRQVAAWMHDDALRVDPRRWPRWLAGKLRAQVWRATRRWRRGGDRRIDLRDRFGTHGLPVEYHEWVERRFDAFCEHRVPPYEGAMLLVRSRSGSMFGPPAAALEEDWRRLALGPFTSASIACSHRGLLQEPHVRELAAQVQAALDDVAS